MIAQALEDLYPDSTEHPSLYPKNQSTGNREHVALQKLLSQFWTDRALFGIAAGLLPWTSVCPYHHHSSESHRDR